MVVCSRRGTGRGRRVRGVGARVRGLGRGGPRRAGTPVVLLVPPVDRPGRVVFRRRAGRSAGEGRGGRGGRRRRRDRRRPRRAARREGNRETRRTRRSRARPPPNPPRRSSRTSRPSPSRRARRRTAEGGRGVLRSIAPRRARACSIDVDHPRPARRARATKTRVVAREASFTSPETPPRGSTHSAALRARGAPRRVRSVRGADVDARPARPRAGSAARSPRLGPARAARPSRGPRRS